MWNQTTIFSVHHHFKVLTWGQVMWSTFYKLPAASCLTSKPSVIGMFLAMLFEVFHPVSSGEHSLQGKKACAYQPTKFWFVSDQIETTVAWLLVSLSLKMMNTLQKLLSFFIKRELNATQRRTFTEGERHCVLYGFFRVLPGEGMGLPERLWTLSLHYHCLKISPDSFTVLLENQCLSLTNTVRPLVWVKKIEPHWTNDSIYGPHYRSLQQNQCLAAVIWFLQFIYNKHQFTTFGVNVLC